MINIDPFSVSSRYIELYFNDQLLSSATGFFIEYDGNPYLTTNLHCFSGRNIFTRTHLSTSLAEPNKVRFLAFESGDMNCPIICEERLLDEEGRRLWLESPRRGSPIDIAALKCSIPTTMALPINRVPQEKIHPTVSADVFILGYPAGLRVDRTAIWKRGTIASEIGIPINDLPAFLVDASTTTGMSGSPVLFRSTQMHVEGCIIQSSEPFQKMIGIYSGRVPAINGVETSLGYVWPVYLVHETVQQKELAESYWDPVVPNRQGPPPPGVEAW